MSYPEFMQRRSTDPAKAIVEDNDGFLPGMRSGGGAAATISTADLDNNNNNNNHADSNEDQQQQQQPENNAAASAQEDQQQQTTATTSYQPQLKCVKDIWQAAIEGDVECLEANVQLGVPLSELGQPVASASKDASTVQIWGPLFDRCALFKATPLQYACAYNRIEAARYLLSQGASWEQLSSTGVSAKDYARRRGYAEILQLILDAENARKSKQ